MSVLVYCNYGAIWQTFHLPVLLFCSMTALKPRYYQWYPIGRHTLIAHVRVINVTPVSGVTLITFWVKKCRMSRQRHEIHCTVQTRGKLNGQKHTTEAAKFCQSCPVWLYITAFASSLSVLQQCCWHSVCYHCHPVGFLTLCVTILSSNWDWK